ncbi:MAG: hypothetical protein A2904_02555 [Candidatus Staskawiczbacteria bacterium RIFCSPLOWO2_01_FULL_33_9]|uniref:Uncharacterized protein n=1 Tax=Candidatus Staskawiczbacteria bacterium RIFCSPLOWO2_01_FULL_33_9 TaxID=1802211 RepID=A0A1G2I7I8_9BACT|nr:MAG: hypothetical protein A2904_02555 [Candidatus Staskawiczbacteria bacterium RIFCSPLOWO2_01_FULL_33_9]
MTGNEGFDRNALALSYGVDFGVLRLWAESNDAYRERLSGVLRGSGKIIEAHEVFSGRRYDDPEQGVVGPMAGITGALAQAMSGRDYSPHNPERQIGDDIATGVVVKEGRKLEESIARIFGLLGPEAGMDFLDSRYKK